MSSNPLAVARASLTAFVDKDRAAIEKLLADDYRFTSPIDNALDRATYLARCWPHCVLIDSFDFMHGAEDGERAFVVYEARTSTGKRFRNCEMHIVRGGRLVATEVYFGWNLPHPARDGGRVENDGEEHA